MSFTNLLTSTCQAMGDIGSFTMIEHMLRSTLRRNIRKLLNSERRFMTERSFDFLNFTLKPFIENTLFLTAQFLCESSFMFHHLNSLLHPKSNSNICT